MSYIRSAQSWVQLTVFLVITEGLLCIIWWGKQDLNKRLELNKIVKNCKKLNGMYLQQGAGTSIVSFHFHVKR